LKGKEMADTSVTLGLDKKVILKPKLNNTEGETMDWDKAKSELGASASWADLDNFEVGTLTPNEDGTAEFIPAAEGVTGVRCDVTYNDPVSGEPGGSVTANVAITVEPA